MSCNRENICWQSKNGKWTLAFYEFWSVDEDSPEFDAEWDVEYGEGFNWVSSGHPTYDAAQNSWTGSNPGGGQMLLYSEQSAKECEALDAKAVKFLAEEKERENERCKLFGGHRR